MLDFLHLDVKVSLPLNIYISWGLDGGNYLLVDGGVLAVTVTIKLLALLTYQLGKMSKLMEHYPCHGIRPTGLRPLIAQ